MKINKLHLLWNMAALLLCASAVSCSQDEPGIEQGELLPPDKYPLELTASSIGEAQSRATGKDEWTCDGSEHIGVRIGADGNIGEYVIGTGNSVEPASIGQTIYWQNTAPATVTAWYPFEAQKGKDIADQSNGYGAIDFLKATAADKIFTDKVELRFIHQMAKVKCVLAKDASITDDEFDGAKVAFYGYTSASFENGELTGTDNGWITPTAADCEALLVPQDMTGKPLIKVSINDNDFIYTPDTEDACNLQAGYQHSYNITVKANGIEVTAVASGRWMDDGSEEVGITIIYDGTETEAKNGDYYYADGTWSDGGLRKLYADGTMEWEETVPQPEDGKTCIGIVFHTGQHPADQSDYTSTGIGQEKCRGYVVALTDAGRYLWASKDYAYVQNAGTSTSADDWEGYSNQKAIENFAETNIDGWKFEHFEAAYQCSLYGTENCADWQKPLAAPSNTSGWFLPSCGQLLYLCKNSSFLSVRMDVVKNSVAAGCNYTDKIEWFSKSGYYWSSSEYSKYSERGGWGVDFEYGDGFGSLKESVAYVRPVLAF